MISIFQRDGCPLGISNEINHAKCLPFFLKKKEEEPEIPNCIQLINISQIGVDTSIIVAIIPYI
jgi:hypothetical protein